VKELYNKNTPALELYRDQVLPLFSPPVFHKWFLDRCPEPSTWLEARLRYSRSAAVMSMIGYIVGYVFRNRFFGNVVKK
jgi:serine/threonine-protein kinase ATR